MKINLDDVKQWVRNQGNSMWFGKTLVSGIILILMFIPLYILSLAWWLLSPVGFWQVFAVVCIWLISLGWIQGACVFFGFIWIIAIIFGDY
jgi:hypothetical protein